MYVNLTAVAVALATTDEVLSLNTEQADVLALEVKNTGANPLDAFEVWGKVTPSGNPIKLADLAAHYTTPNFPVIRASGSPVTLAAGATAWLLIDARLASSMSVKASAGTGATTLEIHASTREIGFW